MESSAFNNLLVGDGQHSRLQRQLSRANKVLLFLVLTWECKLWTSLLFSYMKKQTLFQRPNIERSTSFTDLAAALSKIPTVRPVLRHSLSAYDQAEDVFDDLDFWDREFRLIYLFLGYFHTFSSLFISQLFFFGTSFFTYSAVHFSIWVALRTS